MQLSTETSGIHPKARVLLPLYIYPSPGAWDTLHRSILAYPRVEFIIVVNPHNGPGKGTSPDDQYKTEIAKLNSRHNVVVIGYISTAYAKRDLSAVLHDLKTYSGWSMLEGNVGVRGIFLDETPSQWDSQTADFLHDIDLAVRTSPELGLHPLIVHNPGTIPDARFMSIVHGPDITVVFEETYQTYMDLGLDRIVASLKMDRRRIACLMHSVPDSLITTYAGLASIVKDLRGIAGSFFVTNQVTDLYTSLGDNWGPFIQAMDE